MTKSSLQRAGASILFTLFLCFSTIYSAVVGRTPALSADFAIINEWSQGSSGRKEWVEILVVQPNLDMRGWDLGDSSAGDLTFSQDPLWNDLPAGTLIVIYNGSDRDELLPTDDLDVADWLVVVSSSESRLFSGSWGSLTNGNDTDNPQLRNALDEVIHDFSDTPGNALHPAGGESVFWGGGDLTGIDDIADWMVQPAAAVSPGSGNSPSNQSLIESIKSDVIVQPEPMILIEKAYPDGLATGEADEAIRLINVDDSDADLTGWGISDDSDSLFKLTFPTDVILNAGEGIWITKNGAEFEAQFGHPADYELVESSADVENMLGSWPGFANSGDEVILANGSGTIVDALVYEAGDTAVLTAGGEWQGAPLEFYSVGAKAGQIFFRKLDPISGQVLTDTNSAADWGQDISDPVSGRLVEYPGWDKPRFFTPYSITQSSTLTVAIAPDNAYGAIAGLFDGAKASILIETHTFDSHDLLGRLTAAAERGVEVTILLEGGPPGGIDDAQRWNCYQLKLAGGRCVIMQNSAADQVFDRYTFVHAKFMLIDGKTAVIGSDNLSPNSLPADEKSDGTHGRRGVTLITDAAGVVAHLQAVFAADLDQADHRDVIDWNPTTSSLGLPLAGYVPAVYENGITYTVAFSQPEAFTGDFEYEIIQAPENYLNPEKGLFKLLSQAGPGDTILAEQQYERRVWGDESPNLRLIAYLEAARRGAHVEILLDRFFDDEDNDRSNAQTCRWLAEIAKSERLDLACQTGNPTGLGIHNKMVLAEIDGRGYVHVGSVNGSEQSAKLNREMALQVRSDGAYRLLRQMFQQDFVKMVYLPLLFNDYIAPPDLLLISEVLYNPFGSTDGAEFIEIVNSSNMPLDISGFSLSDGVTAADYADLRRFPAGTILPPQAIIVVTQQAAEFRAQFLREPDFEILDSDPSVPNMEDDLAWGDPSTFLRLSNSGDAVFLRDRLDVPVDVLVYGEKVVEGYPSCSLAVVNGASLRRNPFNTDTDSCADFEEWASPTPGQVP